MMPLMYQGWFNTLGAVLHSKWFWFAVLCAYIALCFWQPEMTWKITATIIVVLAAILVATAIIWGVWKGCGGC